MSKISARLNVSNLENVSELARFTSIALGDIGTQLDGNINFQDNMSIQTFNVSVKTSNGSFAHGLGRVPLMWIAGNNSSSGVISQWKPSDQNNVYLVATSAVSATILVI
jgi:hypothetical protein